jgi:hypothetical protein
MPKISNANLTLTTVDEKTRINVKYQVEFSKLERELARLGLIYRERIAAIGVDPSQSTTGTVLHSFEPSDISVNTFLIDGPEKIDRNLTFTVPRSSLQEDTPAGDADEIRCRIRIAAVGLPPAVTPDVFTDQETLLG